MTQFHESMDRTIDEVARAMTAAPAPALGARVVARLGPRPSSRPSWLAPAAVVLATASVALLVVIIRSRPVAVRAPAVASSAALQSPVIAKVPSPEVQRPDVDRPAIQRAAPTTKADPEATAWLERAVPVLEAVPGLTVTSIQPATPTIAQLQVAPIAPAEPLVVKAIGSDR
jgi:hypothetical protein